VKNVKVVKSKVCNTNGQYVKHPEHLTWVENYFCMTDDVK